MPKPKKNLLCFLGLHLWTRVSEENTPIRLLRAGEPLYQCTCGRMCEPGGYFTGTTKNTWKGNTKTKKGSPHEKEKIFCHLCP